MKLGDTLRDNITGFEGVAIAVTDWLHGCRRFTLQPKALKDGKPIDAVGFDEPQLTVVKEAAPKAKVATGGDRPTPSRGQDTPAR